MLNVKDLSVNIDNKAILKNLNIQVKSGEVHAIMGPNGSGKSTLSKVIAGYPDYEVSSGEIQYEVNFKYKNLFDLSPEERAREGLFLGYQYPIEVPGVSNFEFLRGAFNTIASHQGSEELDVFDFREFINSKLKLLDISDDILDRQLNVGFSGGEKKRNEILQMAVLSPRLAILDETDSGLDIDALRLISKSIRLLQNKDNSIVLITHYQRLLNYIVPDFVHILCDGKIVCSGDKSLALEVEKNGYEQFLK